MNHPTGTAVPVATLVHPVPVQTWRDVLASDPDAMAQQTPEYAAAVRAVTGAGDSSRLYTLADGRRLVLPLVRRSPLPGLHWDADFPTGYGHGGLLADGGVRPEDVRVVIEDLRRLGGLSVGLDGHHHTSARWLSSGVEELDRVTVSRRRVDVIDLSRGFDDVWDKGFSRAARSNARKAERKGVHLERDTTGRLVGVFYEIYLGWVAERSRGSTLPAPLTRHLARRRDSLSKIQTIATMLGEDCRVWIAWHQGAPVAGSISMVHGAYAIGWRTASIKALANPVAANTYLHAEEFRDASASGCRSFDMGQSSDVPGLLDYKRSLGGRPREVVDVRIERPAVTRLRTLKVGGRTRLERLVSRRPPRVAGSAAPSAAK